LSDIRILATTISDWFKRFEDWSASIAYILQYSFGYYKLESGCDNWRYDSRI
jgi:hypothetical protein